MEEIFYRKEGSSLKKFFYMIATIILGVILHFVYEWSGGNPVVALIGATNESTWEHLKLLFFPFLLTSVIEYFTTKPDFEKFLSSRCIGMISGLFSIIVLFYTYTGIYKNVDWINIVIYILSVIIAFYISERIYKRAEFHLPSALSIALFFCLTILFFSFTFYPPDINLFKAPVK